MKRDSDKLVYPEFSSQQHGTVLPVLMPTRVSAESTLLFLQVCLRGWVLGTGLLLSLGDPNCQRKGLGENTKHKTNV